MSGEPRYCAGCGKPLAVRTFPLGRYSSQTGEEATAERLACPDAKWLDFGHATYRRRTGLLVEWLLAEEPAP